MGSPHDGEREMNGREEGEGCEVCGMGCEEDEVEGDGNRDEEGDGDFVSEVHFSLHGWWLVLSVRL